MEKLTNMETNYSNEIKLLSEDPFSNTGLVTNIGLHLNILDKFYPKKLKIMPIHNWWSCFATLHDS